jgi:predicted Zn-dependent peptidase
MNEISNIMDPIPDDEIARARNYMAMQFPQRFQSVSALAGQIEDMARYQLPRDEYDHYVDNVLAVDAANLTRVSLLYFDPNNLAIVVVGNRVAIEQQIRALDLGEVTLLSVGDVLGPAPDLSAQ